MFFLGARPRSIPPAGMVKLIMHIAIPAQHQYLESRLLGSSVLPFWIIKPPSTNNSISIAVKDALLATADVIIDNIAALRLKISPSCRCAQNKKS
ncbi:MAG TPA: hypothetical protein VJ695_10615 [Nitrososphaera sp.]|nr:hypothetical protein [Nitrososphaera sp.]